MKYLSFAGWLTARAATFARSNGPVHCEIVIERERAHGCLVTIRIDWCA
jgi:hypothetical protein